MEKGLQAFSLKQRESSNTCQSRLTGAGPAPLRKSEVKVTVSEARKSDREEEADERRTEHFNYRSLPGRWGERGCILNLHGAWILRAVSPVSHKYVKYLLLPLILRSHCS
ncbi:hypothetical protein GJAV_G00176300 [Gymnothorax javanicus]|nr:hypothetical protein GJAV_G00176300 [Gymnothorax javanicus]